MTKTTDEIAEAANPGWTVVSRDQRVKRTRAPEVRARVGTPDLSDLRRRYLGDAAAAAHDGFKSASSLSEDDTEYVEMMPQGAGPGSQRRTVIISNGKAVAIQG